MRLPEQVTRLGVVIPAIVAVVLLLRFFILPDSVLRPAAPGGEGRARDGEARELRGRGHLPRMPRGRVRGEVAGSHRKIGCENCHGPAAAHAANRKGEALPGPGTASSACDATPTTPRGLTDSRRSTRWRTTPASSACAATMRTIRCSRGRRKECSGCHGRITHTKDQSTHGPLACTECHQVDERTWPTRELHGPASLTAARPAGGVMRRARRIPRSQDDGRHGLARWHARVLGVPLRPPAGGSK